MILNDSSVTSQISEIKTENRRKDNGKFCNFCKNHITILKIPTNKGTKNKVLI